MDEEIRFQVDCVTDYQSLLTLNRVVGRTTLRRRYLALRLFRLLFGAFGVYAGLSGLINLGPGFLICWICLLLSLFFLASGIFLYQYFAWRSWRLQRRRSRNEPARLFFTDEKLRARSDSFEGSYEYSTVLGQYEWDHYLVLLLDKRIGSVLDENSLSGGTPEELRQFISGRTGLPVIRLHK